MGKESPLGRMEMKLPCHVHFLVPKGYLWPSIGSDYQMDIEELARNPRGTIGAWLIRTFIELRRSGASVSISDQIKRHAVNVSDAFSFGRRRRLHSEFMLIARSDGPIPGLANFVIHQNGLIPDGPAQANIPHWPQPGLVGRDPSRGTRLERLAFKGEPWNLDERFRTPEVLERLASLGMTLELPDPDRNRNATSWGDYKDSDAVIAVRNLTVPDSLIKPASKLVNAWFAGIPAILGPEPAFRELRTGPLDYFEVVDADGMFAVLEDLRDKPELYKAVVENGRKRSEAFQPEAIVKKWYEVLAGAVEEERQKWISTPLVSRWTQVAAMLLQEPHNRREHVKAIHNGERILG